MLLRTSNLLKKSKLSHHLDLRFFKIDVFIYYFCRWLDDFWPSHNKKMWLRETPQRFHACLTTLRLNLNNNFKYMYLNKNLEGPHEDFGAWTPPKIRRKSRKNNHNYKERRHTWDLVCMWVDLPLGRPH